MRVASEQHVRSTAANPQTADRKFVHASWQDWSHTPNFFVNGINLEPSPSLQ